MKRLNILISAHEFSPDQGSECAVGWNFVQNLSKYHNITVIYAETNQFGTSNYKQSVKKFLKKEGNYNNVKLIAIPQPKKTLFLAQINRFFSPYKTSIGFPPIYYLAYNFWQKEVFRIAKQLHEVQKYDCVHQLTSISFREPGYLYKLNIPFIWGPISGLVKFPYAFARTLSLKNLLFELIRRLSNWLIINLSYRHKIVLKKASVIYTVTNDDYNYYQLKSGSNVKRMLDVGAYENSTTEIKTIAKDNSKIKLLWVGRIVDTKGLDLLLTSISQSDILKNQTQLTIVGDGPLRNKSEKLITKLGLTNIECKGNITHKDVFELMGTSDALIFSSIKEATSAVVLESLTFGLPVICHDAFGMSYAINDTCGIKIPLISPAKSIDGFKEALLKIVNHPDELSLLKTGALERAKELTWDSMAKIIAEDYNSIALTKSK